MRLDDLPVCNKAYDAVLMGAENLCFHFLNVPFVLAITSMPTAVPTVFCACMYASSVVATLFFSSEYSYIVQSTVHHHGH